MKKINPGFIAANKMQPYKKGTWVHLQQAYQEAITAIGRLIAGDANYDPTKVYVLYGCVNSGTLPDYDISAGAVFFNGEIYLTDAASFTATGSDIAVGTIAQTQYTDATADPVTFTDGSINNVHDIFKIIWTAGASGSGDADFDDNNVNQNWHTMTDIVNGQVTISTGTISFLLIQYRKTGDSVEMMFTIGGTVTVAAAGITAKIDLPWTRKAGTIIAGSCVLTIADNSMNAAVISALSPTNRERFFVTSTVNPGTGTFSFEGSCKYAIE